MAVARWLPMDQSKSSRWARVARATAVTAAGLAMAGSLAACGGGGAATTAAGALASASASSEPGQSLDFIVELTSADRTLHTVGPNSSLVYGRNNLVGEAEVNGQPVRVEFLGNVDYVSGRGPFDGFITLVFPDDAAASPTPSESGSAGDTASASAAASPGEQAPQNTIGIRVDGEATPVDSGSKFAARLEVIGGTGTYADTVGAGSFSGSRTDALGGAVRLDITLVLDDGTQG